MPDRSTIRVLALIPPIEQHVGHWACSTPSLDVRRTIMDDADPEARLLADFQDHCPQVIAVIGKRAREYLDMLDRLCASDLRVGQVPRVYRCQNTVLNARVQCHRPAREFLASVSAWFAAACDPRFALVFVQTLDDVELIRLVLEPVTVHPCPFGYDPTIFDPDLPELERTVDVGCYMTLRGDERRVELVETARAICHRRGWTFKFEEGKYWHQYAEFIRTSKICLHRSAYGEVPFRMFETAACGAVFLTDPLRCRVEDLFELGSEYLTYHPDLSDLESLLASLLGNPPLRESIAHAGQSRAREYSWPRVAETFVAPALRQLLASRPTAFQT